jgi:hypothetical protein
VGAVASERAAGGYNGGDRADVSGALRYRKATDWLYVEWLRESASSVLASVSVLSEFCSLWEGTNTPGFPYFLLASTTSNWTRFLYGLM